LNIKTIDKKEKGEAEIVVEANAEEFEAAVAKAFLKNRNRMSVPGFRKGKAPRRIIERMYGASIFHPDALEILYPDVLEIVEEELEHKIVGTPKLTDVDIKEDNEGAEISVSVTLYPEFTLGEYKGLSAVKQETEVPESAIDAEIAEGRLRNARIEKVERPAIEGDIAVFDFEGFIDGEPFDGGQADNYELELGSNSFIEGFEEKMLGMTPGEERELDLQFPEQYAEPLAGKPVLFKVKLHELKEKQLPDLDDEFAKDVSEFDTLKEYKESIRARLEKTKQEDSDSSFENALMDQLAESLEADIPDVMIDKQQELTTKNFLRQLSMYGIDLEKYLQMTSMTPAMFKESMRLKSEHQVKITLALEKIAELEGIEVSDDDLEEEYNETAERYGMELDKLKEALKEKDFILEVKLRRATKIVVDNAIAGKPDSGAGDPESGDETAAGAKKAADKPKKAPAKKAAAKKPTEKTGPESEE